MMCIMAELFNNFIYEPLYNLLIFLINILPFHSVALAVIVLTVLVKTLLLPLAYKMAKTQKKIKEISPLIEEIKEKYKDDKHTQTLKIMALYKEHEIKPLGSFLMLFIQLPVIIGLYWVFLKSGLPEINKDILYSFVSAPEAVNMHLLNISMSDKSITMALLAGITQFAFASMTSKDMRFTDEQDGFKADLQKSLHIQMRFVLPAFIAFIAYSLGAGIALYFIVSNIFQILQEYYLRFKKVK